MISFGFLHRKWMKEPGYRKEYDALEEEFVLIATVARFPMGSRLKIGLEPAWAGKKRKAGYGAKRNAGRSRRRRKLDCASLYPGYSCQESNMQWRTRREL